MHVIAILNKDGGTFRTMDMEAFCAKAREVFAAAGHTLDTRIVAGAGLQAALSAAAQDPSVDAVLAGGGDGTISAAAGVCFAAGKPLGVLPAGTMNLFARSLRVPLALDQALLSLASGQFENVDIATANGQPFVYQYSIGMHTRLVALRNGLPYRSRIGKILASGRAMVEALSRPLKFDVDLVTATGIEHRRAMAVAISNNPLGEGHLPYADTLDRGALGVYVVAPMPPLETARLAATLAFGRWKSHPLVSEKQVKRVSLHFRKLRKGLQAVVDGELVPLPAHVDLEIHAGGLKVLAPAVVTAPAPAPLQSLLEALSPASPSAEGSSR